MPPIEEEKEEITATTFSYPMWEKDNALVEKTLSISSNTSAKKYAAQKVKAMKNKQYLHDGGEKLHPGIAKIQKPGAFTYDGFDQDMKEAFKQYMLGHDEIVDRLVSQIELKQNVHDGNRSDPILVELDSLTFCYPGWKDDKDQVEEVLTSSDPQGVYQDARHLLKEMKRKQEIFEEDGFPPGITLLHSGVFSYPNFAQDKETALDLHEQGDEEAFDQMLERIQSKQSLHDGSGTHSLMVDLDATEFSYPGWREDRIFIEDTLMHSVNAFAEYDAKRLFVGMKNKQRLFTGTDLHPGIVVLRSRTFTYKGFKRDKLDAIREYRAGHDSAFEKRVAHIQEKQALHDSTSGVSKSALVSPVSSTCSPTNKSVSFSSDLSTVVSPTDGTKKKKKKKSKKSSDEDRIRTKDIERFVPDDCVICLSAPRTHIFAPCGHLCLCNHCAFKTPYRKRKISKKNFCPICRQESSSIVKVYF